MSKRLLSYAVAVALLTACQSRSNESRAGQTAATRPDSSAAMAKMPGMSNGGMMDNTTMMMTDSMRAEMTRMNAMTPEQMKSMMASHRQMAGNMLAQMNSDMRAMNMTGDPAWTALVDSVRRDLVHMPDVSGAPLKTLMAAHQQRMERLMAMHRDMMGKASGAKK